MISVSTRGLYSGRKWGTSDKANMAQKRQTRKRPKSTKRGDDASLYPLDPETAIRAIMDAGPHPKESKPVKPQKHGKN
jgi:hypothetical protein